MAKKILKGCLIVIVIFVLLIVAIQSFFGEERLYSSGRDTYVSFGDGRFQIMQNNDGSKSLFDLETSSVAIMNNVERFFEKDNDIYVTGYYAYTSVDVFPCAYMDLDSGETLFYNSIEEIPRYTILNYETGEAVQYLYFEDIPEEEQAIFEEPLTEECLKDRTCYEKEE